MNCSLTLSQRLSLVFTVVLLFCAAVTCGVHIYSSNLYGNAMVQRLSAGLAQQIVITESLLDNRGQVNHRTLKSLFERLMTLNPSVELYIVSPEGRLLVEAAPPGHIKRRYINIAPLKKFLSGAVWPVYGDDPRSVNKKKVFSTAPLYLRDDLKGYLYIILQGEELNALTDAAWTKALWNALYWSLFLVVICGLLSGMLVWYWVTRPIQQLTENVSGIEQDSISAIKQLATQRPATPLATRSRYYTMPSLNWPVKYPVSGINFQKVINSAVNLLPISPMIYGRH